MLEKLLQMSNYGIFDIMNRNDIKQIINDCKNDEDVKQNLDEIQSYIKFLDATKSRKVLFKTKISDFCDKFQDELFYISKRSDFITSSSGIYQKELSYGNGGTFNIGIKKANSYFHIYERKLLKLVNHYYIMSKQNDEKEFYIPLSSLRYLFSSDINNYVMKEEIIKAVESLNSKNIYWDFSNSRLDKSKKLNENNLTVGKDEPIVDLQIVYLPREHENGKNKTTNTILGIYGRETSFMKMRYLIKQIYNKYPTSELRLNSLGYDLCECVLYKLAMLENGRDRRITKITDNALSTKVKKSIGKKLKNNIKKSLNELFSVLYYDTGESYGDSYYQKFVTEPNQKRTIKTMLKSMTEVSAILYHECRCTPVIVAGNRKIGLTKDFLPRSVDVVYDKILEALDTIRINDFIINGEIFYKIELE